MIVSPMIDEADMLGCDPCDRRLILRVRLDINSNE